MPAHARPVDPRPRTIATISLIVATLGHAIPYGTASGPANPDLNALEVALSILALLAGVGLILDLSRLGSDVARRRGSAFMVAGFVWAVITVYVLAAPGDHTLWWRIGHAIPDAAWAVLALTAWRLAATRHEVTP